MEGADSSVGDSRVDVGVGSAVEDGASLVVGLDSCDVAREGDRVAVRVGLAEEASSEF